MEDSSKAVLIYPDGTTKNVTPKNGQDFDLSELKEMVEGYIEIITNPFGNKYAVCNEEGKLLGLPINQDATITFGLRNDWFCGNVLICDVDMIK